MMTFPPGSPWCWYLLFWVKCLDNHWNWLSWNLVQQYNSSVEFNTSSHLNCWIRQFIVTVGMNIPKTAWLLVGFRTEHNFLRFMLPPSWLDAGKDTRKCLFVWFIEVIWMHVSESCLFWESKKTLISPLNDNKDRYPSIWPGMQEISHSWRFYVQALCSLLCPG